MPTSQTKKSEELGKSGVDQEGKNTSAIKYLCVDSSQKKERNATKMNKQDERVLVCVKLDKKGKLTVEKSTTEKLKKSQKDVKLVLYVKDSDQKDFSKGVKDKLGSLSIGLDSDQILDRLKEHLELCYQVTYYDDFPSMVDNFDKETGEKKEGIRGRLKLSLSEAEEKRSKLINELDEQCNIKFSQQDESKLKECILAMKKILDQTKGNNVSDLSSKESDFILKRDKFNEELETLNKKYRLESIKKSVEALLVKFETLVPQNAKIEVKKTEKILREQNELKENLKALSAPISKPKASDLSIEEIEGLEQKFEEYNGKFSNLEQEIQMLVNPPEEILPIVLDEKKLDELKEAISEVKLKIKNHSTSGEKIAIKKEIEGQLGNILEKSSLENLRRDISITKIYISVNKDKISAYTGILLFNGSSKLNELVGELNPILDNFEKFLSDSANPDKAMEASPAPSGLRP